ncbi:hypothetical protein K7G98_42440, partial [Saccharothrix sp. MB29]|nr:hypothetical protein [Saccharothrix sp. MB29]
LILLITPAWQPRRSRSRSVPVPTPASRRSEEGRRPVPHDFVEPVRTVDEAERTTDLRATDDRRLRTRP